MQFAGFTLQNNLFVAPHGWRDGSPFPPTLQKMGRGSPSEMVTHSLLYGSGKTQRRANHDGETDPISVQIAGADPAMMAEAARHNIDRGAQIIDINMGCPAKKVCNVMAGSALMQDEPWSPASSKPSSAQQATSRSRSNSAPAGTPPIKRADDRAHRRRIGHPAHCNPRPHPRLPIHRPRRIRHHRRRQNPRAHSTDRQRRHHHAEKPSSYSTTPAPTA